MGNVGENVRGLSSQQKKLYWLACHEDGLLLVVTKLLPFLRKTDDLVFFSLSSYYKAALVRLLTLNQAIS